MTNYSFSKTKSTPKELDYYIGKRVKARRSSLGVSQEKLGASLGVTFQQIQKYEKGINRISASTLYGIANVLSVDFSYFTEGYHNTSFSEETVPAYEFDAKKRKESVELLRAYYKVTDQNVRKKILELIKTFSVTAQKQEKQ